MKKIIMTLGLPASGKSTWAKAQEKFGVARISKDDLRIELHEGVFSKENEREVNKVQKERIIIALELGHTIIVDNTNFGWEDRLRAIAEEYNAEFEIKNFTDVSMATCIERNSKRTSDRVPTRVIKDMYYKYVNKAPNYSNQDRFIMCDIDGTLAHMEGRSPFDGKNVHTDKVDIPVAFLLDAMRDYGFSIIIVTARDEKYLQLTEQWLKNNDICYDDIFIRPAGDNREDSIVKQEIYEQQIKPKYGAPMFVLDDRNRVVDMWRKIGLKCLQCEAGDF